MVGAIITSYNFASYVKLCLQKIAFVLLNPSRGDYDEVPSTQDGRGTDGRGFNYFRSDGLRILAVEWYV
jgi:hypothetical protein